MRRDLTNVSRTLSILGWVNFSGTGVVTINDSVNVVSITDNGGTGDYTINWDQAFPATAYCLAGFAMNEGSTSRSFIAGGAKRLSATSTRFTVQDGSGNLTDYEVITLVAIGHL